jgi:hypothetical protein
MGVRAFVRSVCSILLCVAAGLPGAGSAQDGRPAVAIIADTEWIFRWGHRDRGVSGLNECLETILAETGHVVIPQAQFLQAAFPALPPDKAPTTPRYLELALQDPEVNARLERLNVEHIVYVTGVLELEKDIQDMETYCALVGNVPACIGGIVYEQTHWLKATILDVDTNAVLTTSRADESGKSTGINAYYLPILFEANTRSVACDELAAVVSQQVRNDLARASE